MRIVQHFVGISDGFGCVNGWFHVVRAIHDQQVEVLEFSFSESAFSASILAKRFKLVGGQVRTVGITVA